MAAFAQPLATLGEDEGRLPAALRRAAVRATLAPSVHNTQPWRFVIGADGLAVYGDYDRRLRVLDPTGRQLIISCGCALFNARVSLAASGLGTVSRYGPDPNRPDLLARLALADGEFDHELAVLDPVIELRRTNRRQFAADPVSESEQDRLIAAAQVEGAEAVAIRRPEHRLSTAVLSQRADALQNADPGYRAELRAWVSNDPIRTDGVPQSTIPHGGGGAHDDIPLRDFDAFGAGLLPEETRSSMSQCLLLLGSKQDNSHGWLHTGEALERLWLEATRSGYALSLFTQVIEVPSTRAMLRAELGLNMQPHLLVRIGRAPATPASRRRRVVDVLREET